MSEWIPCEKRLPEKGKRVLETIRGLDIICPHVGETLWDCAKRQYKEIVHIGIACRDDGYWIENYFPMIVEPCAWMPRPEPWEGE